MRKADKLIDARLGEGHTNEKYQGHANWGTWNVVLWVFNEEPTYRAMRRGIPYDAREAERFVMSVFPNGTPDMDGARDLREVDWDEVAEAFNEE